MNKINTKSSFALVSILSRTTKSTLRRLFYCLHIRKPLSDSRLCLHNIIFSRFLKSSLYYCYIAFQTLRISLVIIPSPEHSPCAQALLNLPLLRRHKSLLHLQHTKSSQIPQGRRNEIVRNLQKKIWFSNIRCMVDIRLKRVSRSWEMEQAWLFFISQLSRSGSRRWLDRYRI